jgi:hypothetical protein
MELFQRWQQGFDRGKPAKAEAPFEVEPLERGETCQRGEIAAETLAPSEAERLERDEACQRGEITAEILARGEVERLE